MAVKLSPITPAVLGWALSEDGRSLGEVARTLKVDRELLSAWVSGDAQPTLGQVSELAHVLHRPRALFFLPRAPSASATPTGFRQPPGGGSRHMPDTVLRRIRQARRIQLAVSSTIADDQLPSLPRATVEESAAEAATRARQWLGLDGSERWDSPYAALAWWRRMLDEVGVLVFNLELGRDQVRGFAAWDERAPAIVLNASSVSPQARVFTLAHELGHLLLRQETACDEPRGTSMIINSRTERWCEQFAAALIMPRSAVDALMRARGIAQGDAGIDEVKALMERFRCSARASAVRLDGLGYAQAGLYAAVLAIFRPSTARAQSGTVKRPRRHVQRRQQYGENTVVQLLQQLPPSDSMSVLRLTVDDVRSLADEVPGVPAF